MKARLLAPLIALAAASCVPELGAVDGATFGRAVRVRDPQLGASVSPGVVVRIEVDEDGARPPASAGRLVKRAYFSDVPPFVFNVSFACGGAGPDGRGSYADPHSIWFNVFVGYYEIEVSKAKWGRPFGYRVDGSGTRVVLTDLVRIAKADWNYFSNYVYGVPLEAVRPYDSLDRGEGHYLGRVRVGERHWDLVELRDFEVVSAYVSDRDGQNLVSPDPVSTPLWRSSFGGSSPRSDFPKSFIPTRMRARLYISYSEGYDRFTHEVVYRTAIFGGTTNDIYPDRATNDRFLDVQMAAVREVMTTSYAELGFR